jgi:hypothetical protein
MGEIKKELGTKKAELNEVKKLISALDTDLFDNACGIALKSYRNIGAATSLLS